MSIDLIYTNSSGRFNNAECKRLSDLSGCSLPEKEFTESEYEMIFDLYGYVGMDIPRNMDLLAPWLSYFSGWYHQKGPHSRNPRLRDPNAEQCVDECWYFEYHLDIFFDQKQKAWLSASEELIPGKFSTRNYDLHISRVTSLLHKNFTTAYF